MKTFLLLLLCSASCSVAALPQTFQFAAVAPTSDGSNIISLGTFLLSGESLGYIIRYDSPGFATIRGPEPGGANAPTVLVLEGGNCAADGGCGWGGEAILSSDQVTNLKAGLLYLEINGQFSGRLNLVCLSEFRGQNSLEIPVLLDGDNPTNRLPRIVRWGRGSVGLTENKLSYELRLPSNYGPYTAYLVKPGVRWMQQIVANLGFLSCDSAKIVMADAEGLETLPACVARGSLCLDDVWIPQLLDGSLAIRVTASPHWGLGATLVPPDSDSDGVPDFRDQCLGTIPNTPVNADGCSIEQLCPCDGPWRSHGEFVNRLRAVANQFRKDGLITESQKRAIVNRGSASNCGKFHR